MRKVISRIIKNKIFANASWIVGCKLCRSLLTLVTTMITARYLGVEGYGLISYASGIVAFMTPIMKLGIDAVLVHEFVMKKEKEGEILGTTIGLNVLSSILCIIGVISFVAVANPGDREVLLVCMGYSLMLLFQAFEMTYYWFQAKIMAKVPSIAMLFSYILITVFQVVLVYSKADVFWFAISYSIDYLIVAIVLIAIYKKKGAQKLTFSYDRAKQLLSVSKHYIVATLMMTVFLQTGIIMLNLFVGNHATGIYSAASTAAGITIFVFIAIIDSMRPSIFSSLKDDKNLFEYKLARLYSIIIYLAVFQCIMITICAPIIVKIIYGSAYFEAINVLRIVAWYTPFYYIGTVRNIWILAENKQKYLTIINISSAALIVIMNFILIPIIGVYGAAISTIVSNLFMNVIIGFMIPAMRPNNTILFQSLNPKYIIDIFRK